MGDEKAKCRDSTSTSNSQLQPDQDHWSLNMQNEPCQLAGISADFTGAITVEEPKTMQQPFPLSCEDSFSLVTVPQNPRIDCDNIISKGDSAWSGSVSDSRVEGNVDKLQGGVTLEDMVAAESLANKNNTHVLSHSRDTGEMRDDSNDITSAFQFSSPVKFDGSISSLGAGGSEETRSKLKGSYKPKKSVLPRLTTFCGQKPDASSSNNFSKTAGIVSRFQNNVGGISSRGHNVALFHHLLQNMGENASTIQSATESSGPSQSVHGLTFSKDDYLVPGFRGSTDAGFAIVDPNTGIPAARDQFPVHQESLLQAVDGDLSPERKELKLFVKGQVIPGTHAQASSVPTVLSQNRNATQLAPRARPVLHTIIKPSTHPSISESALVVPFLAAVPSKAQNAAFHQPSSRTAGLPSLAHTACSLSDLPEEIESHRACKVITSGKSQTTGPIQPIQPIQPPDQVISVAHESGLSWTSIASVGQQQKRCANQPPLIARPLQRRIITHPSVPASAQASPSPVHLSQKAPVRPHAHTAASLPFLPQTVHFPRILSPTRVLPSPVHTSNPPSRMAEKIPFDIAKDSNRTPQPSGWTCMLCKRDLFFTQEGPELQPSVPPVVAVLPCGHYFHDSCLQRITLADQSKDPPCIPCALGEN